MIPPRQTVSAKRGRARNGLCSAPRNKSAIGRLHGHEGRALICIPALGCYCGGCRPGRTDGAILGWQVAGGGVLGWSYAPWLWCRWGGGGDFPSPGSATRTWQTYPDALFLKTTKGEISPKVAKGKQTDERALPPTRKALEWDVKF